MLIPSSLNMKEPVRRSLAVVWTRLSLKDRLRKIFNDGPTALNKILLHICLDFEVEPENYCKYLL